MRIPARYLATPELNSALASIVGAIQDGVGVVGNTVERLLHHPSQNGVFKWRVNDFYNTEVKHTKQPILSSNFTFQNGYEMRLLLYLNGYKEGKNSHLSLFLVMTKGQLHHLAWPIRMHVTFTLLNMTNGDDFVASFEHTFCQPTAERVEEEAGFPQFIPQEHVQNGFMLDGVMFIKCEVAAM